jgi:hypothetical protein
VVARGISQQDGSVAGVSAAILTKIGRRALRAGNCRRTVVIRERAGQEPWPVIVVVADLVGQRIMTNMANEGAPRRLFVTPKAGVLVYAERTAKQAAAIIESRPNRSADFSDGPLRLARFGSIEPKVL